MNILRRRYFSTNRLKYKIEEGSNNNNRLFLKSSKRRDRPPAFLSPIFVAPVRPALPTKFGNRELLEPKTPLAVNAGTALARNLASAPGAADTRFAPPTSPPKDPPKVGGGVKDNPNGLGEAVTVPKHN